MRTSTRKPADFDICECGDYRHQHSERGCIVCAADEQCFVFRIFERVVWKAVR